MPGTESLPPSLRLTDEHGVLKHPVADEFEDHQSFHRSYRLDLGMKKDKVSGTLKRTDKFPACMLRFPGCSVNWSRFSEKPEFRWIYEPEQGIAVIPIGNCPRGAALELRFKHTPANPYQKSDGQIKPENYSHCDIDWAKDGNVQVRDMDEEEKKVFRMLMRRAIDIYADFAMPEGYEM